MLKKYTQILLDPKTADGGQSTLDDQQQNQQQDNPTGNANAEGKENEDEAAAGESQADDQPPLTGKDDPLLQALFKDLGDDVPPIKAVPDEDPEDKPAPGDKTDETPAATRDDKTKAGEQDKGKKPDEKPVPANPPKKRKSVSIVTLDEAAVTPPPPAPEPARETLAPAPVPAADPDAEFISRLSAEHQEALAEAEVAARLFPDKYKNRRKELLTYFKTFEERFNKLVQADPNRKMDASDEEYQKLLKSQPGFEPADEKRIQRKMGEEAAAESVRKEFTPKLTELERKQQEIEYRPKVEAVVRSFEKGVGTLLEQKDCAIAPAVKAYKERGAEASQKEFPLESRIYVEEMTNSANMAREYLMFARQLREFDPNNQTHSNLFQFINEQTGQLMRYAEKDPSVLVRNGRSFLPRDEYITLARSNPVAARKHWTFGHQDIMDMLAIQTRLNIESRVRREDDLRKREGYERRATENPPKNEEPKKEPEPLNPPKAKPTPVKGAGGKPKAGKAAEPADEPINVVETLRLKE